MSVEKPVLANEAVKDLHRLDSRKNTLRLLIFGGAYFLAAWGAVSAAGSLHGVLFWICAPPCWLLAGASLHGISLFTHEAVHGTLSKNRALNAVAGALCALPVWQNYSAYRVLHLKHHNDLGGEHDPDHYANYTRWTWGVFILNWLRLVIGYPVYITAIPLLGWKHGNGRSRLGIAAELLLCVAVSWTLFHFLPVSWLLHAWLLPMVFINTMVNIRGMSQHTLLEHPDDEVLGTRSILTNGLVRFFMCNENFHLEHHLYPGIPWYRLPAAHSLLEPELRRRGAPFISSYSSFVMEFIRYSFQRGPWTKKGA
jgi:fatty acid desaturase